MNTLSLFAGCGGMDIGADTKTHTDLTLISEKQAKIEIKDCKIELKFFSCIS